MTVPIAAEPARVYDALHRAGDLHAWFCERADVVPEAKRYDFWGRHTPGAPGRDAGAHALLVYDEPRSLDYAWTIRGGDSRVALAVAASPRGSVVGLHHALPRGRTSREGAMADFWAGSLERMKAWIEKGVHGFLPDFTAPPASELRLSMDVAAPAAEIYRALVDPAQVERYLAMPGKATIEPRVGGRYDIGWEEGGPVRVLAIEPGRKLAYSWRYKSEPNTTATWTLGEPGAGRVGTTSLTIVHGGFGDPSRYEPYFVGWAFFMNRIKLLLEADQGRAAVVTADDYEETSG
jgi:uncharacterized protein YndB with AHSA1/START domain